MSERADRLNQLLTERDGNGLDRPLAVVASVDPDEPPTEDQVVAALDELAAGCPDDLDGPQLLTHLFGTIGFAGNRGNYYDPANSLIHRVLERRRGIPLSLAAVVAEIGRRRGLDLRPVGLPGHVLLGEGPRPERWFDPFAAGGPIGVDTCRAIFSRLNPGGSFEESMLLPMPTAAVVVRTLNNLRVAYASRGMANRLIPVLDLRANLVTGTVADRLELARLLAGLGRVEQAAEEFSRLAELDGQRADAHRARATSLRAHLN